MKYKCQGEVTRQYSVAFVARPRTATEDACMLLSSRKIPSQKLWARDPDLPDPARSVLLDLYEMREWQLASMVMRRVLNSHWMMT